MLGYPPKPTPIFPIVDSFDPHDYIAQPKFRGWRIVIHNNESFTRRGNRIPIETHFRTDFDYQLDGEITASSKVKNPTEHDVRRAIKDGSYILNMFDIYIPEFPRMILLDRLDILRKKFGFDVWSFSIWKIEEISHMLQFMKMAGFEGVVIKRKDSIYRISESCEIVDHEWIKVK